MVGKQAFLFPGQGSQSIGMGRLAFDKSASAKILFEKADAILGFSLSKVMFEGPEDELRQTVVTQPALFLASAAALELVKEKNLTPFVVAGHSLGEYSALYAAGVLSFEDALMLVRERGRAMQQAAQERPGTMAAVLGLDETKVNDICKNASSAAHVCVVANYNSETQIVISGHKEAVEKAMAGAHAAGAAKVVALNVSGAFHSPLMAPAVQKMSAFIEKTAFHDATVPVITNVDAQPTQKASEFKRKLLEQIDHSVQWHASMKKILELGAESFIEVGSGKVLGTMAKKLDRKKNVLFTDDFKEKMECV